MKKLTDKQANILNFIDNYINAEGYPPTVREIGETFKITAKGAYDHLKAIEKKGYIKIDKNKSRAIEVLKGPHGAPTSISSTIQIPLVGRVAAGLPVLAEENIEEYLSFPKSMFPPKKISTNRIFALRVTGDSMIDAGIHDGDIAIIQKQDTANNGDIVVALIEDEATLKYFYRKPKNKTKKIRLEPANKAYKPIFPTSLQIIGVLIGVYRQFK